MAATRRARPEENVHFWVEPIRTFSAPGILTDEVCALASFWATVSFDRGNLRAARPSGRSRVGGGQRRPAPQRRGLMFLSVDVPYA